MAKRASIHAIERRDLSRKKYGISIPRPGATARRVFFDTKKERDQELNKMLRLAAVEGTAPLTVRASDVQLLRDLREILPPDVDPREAARFWMETRTPGAECSVREAVRDHLHSLQLRKLSYDHREHVKTALDRMAAVLGADRLVSSVTDKELTAFFHALPFAARTLANNQQYIRSFFKWCVAAGHCVRSPMASHGRIRVDQAEVSFLPVGDVEKFFKAAADLHRPALPLFALSFFAGFRTSQLERVRRADINFEARGITLPAASHKTGRRFYVEGYPDNLWRWLEPVQKMHRLPKVPKSTLIQWRAKAAAEAGIHYPHNGGRHSFCSYHIALHGDASRTASLLTHRGVSMLYQHYRGNAKKADAEKYFSIGLDD